jgi:hypothetical protein
MTCTLIAPATFNINNANGVYRNASHCLELQFRDENGMLDITGYTLDADIQDPLTATTIATWTITITAPLDGLAEMELTPAQTLAIAAGSYVYDVSLTTPAGDRHYWLKGSVEVYETVSRT